MSFNKITFVQTGGTIDKDYPKNIKGYAFEIADPAVERILQKLQPSFEYEVLPLLKKDSLDITLEDRQFLLSKISKLPTQQIVLTHGTDTLEETALFLAKAELKKTIVLTGAMRPERFSNSDAGINIGMAIAAVQTLNTGVYIVMHGQILTPGKITRNSETGQFLNLD